MANTRKATAGAEGDIEQALLRLRPLVESFLNGNQVHTPESMLTVIGDAAAAAETLDGLIGRAERSVSVLLPASHDDLHMVGSALRRLSTATAEQVRVRILAAPQLAAAGRLADAAAPAGQAAIRLTDGVRNAVVVVDEQVALIRPAPSAAGAQTSLVRAPGVVKALHDTVMTAWRAALPLARHRQLGECLRQESGTHILRLLSEGYTDEAAARELSISVRTYRRRVAEIMRLLGARSRFQAGVHASSIGLLPE